MKIVYLHQYFRKPSENGGIRSYVLAKALVENGHEVHLLTTKNNAARGGWELDVFDGISVHYFPAIYSNELSFFSRLFAFAKFAFFAATKARSLNGDVVIATSTPLTIAIPGIFAILFRRSPMIFEVRDLWPEAPIAIGALKNPVLKALASLLESLAYRASRHIIALSPGMADGVKRIVGDSKGVTVIPNFSDTGSFGLAAKPIPESKSVGIQFLGEHGFKHLIIYTGTIGRVNGIDYMVKMAEAMLKVSAEVGFVVFGSGKCKRDVVVEAESRNVLERNFFIFEPVGKMDLPYVLARSTMGSSFVIDVPELWKNSANKFFDCLAAGRPVLINHEGWQADLIRSKKCGLVVSGSCPKSAAATLNSFLSDKVSLEQAGKNARALAETDFSARNLSAQFVSIVEETVKK